jgi:hypothetical protein
VPGRTVINKFIKKTADPNRDKIGIEKAWTSAALNEEPISPDAIHWLIELQALYRKLYYSKPLTIREARWFNRLSGWREGFSYRSDIDIEKHGEETYLSHLFISHVIATWAQLYAYREKIDTIAGIKELDYSDLDSRIATGRLSAIHDYDQKWAWDAFPITAAELSSVSLDSHISPKSRLVNCPVCGRPSKNSVLIEGFRNPGLLEGLMTKMTKEYLTKWKDKYLVPFMIDQTRFLEIMFLDHSLGDPDMSDSSIPIYSGGLFAALKYAAFRQRLNKLPYIQRIIFLVLLREWAKEHPDAADAPIKPRIKIILDIVEKEGEANGKR